ncbi:MAG: PEP-CTERM sorting domain-containing protein [Nitrospirota bacterium]
MKQILVAVALVMVGLVPGVSHAANFFIDNFNGENGGATQLDYTAFAKWTVSNGSVDLIGEGGPFDFFPPGHGLYVDLDGTLGIPNAGDMTSNLLALGTGTYELTFELAGSQRDNPLDIPPNELTYGVDLDNSGGLNGGEISTVSLSTFDPFTVQTVPFTLSSPQSIRIIFSHSGGDKIGMILDNVSVDSKASIPEPASLMLLGAGLAAIGIWRRKAAKV